MLRSIEQNSILAFCIYMFWYDTTGAVRKTPVAGRRGARSCRVQLRQDRTPLIAGKLSAMQSLPSRSQAQFRSDKMHSDLLNGTRNHALGPTSTTHSEA